jgi:succinate-semialdehyde dehydrogenase/glutarate-semialdehyde dehydrogenase
MPNSAELLASIHTELLIDGRWQTASSGESFEVTDPATGETLRHVANAGPADAAVALDAAVAAQQELARTTPRQRSDFLHDLYREVMAHQSELAAIMTAENGKPLAESQAEVHYGANYLRWYAEEALRIPGLIRSAPDGHTIEVLHRPVGPAYLITPWNFPLAMATRKIAPAIAAGCTSILKPASATPLTALYFADLTNRLVAKHDLPTGTLSVLPSTHSGGLSDTLLGDSRLRKLSFTGSTAVGAQLLQQAAPHILRTSMELGGNAPFIVAEDADLPAAVQGAMAAKMRNSGQTCVAANRFIVAQTVADEFAEQLKQAFAKLVVGAGTAEDTTVGPLISADAVDKVSQLVSESLGHGASLTYQATESPKDGYFYPPTILQTNATDPILGQEIFGPVAPIITYEDLDEAIELANSTEYGLAAYAYTTSLATADRFRAEIDTGMLGLNRGAISDATAPFGGVKLSGLGREGGSEGLLEYLSTRYVARP